MQDIFVYILMVIYHHAFPTSTRKKVKMATFGGIWNKDPLVCNLPYYQLS